MLNRVNVTIMYCCQMLFMFLTVYFELIRRKGN